jgi:L-seryl-tRNA(Ser) seleniumtransferase
MMRLREDEIARRAERLMCMLQASCPQLQVEVVAAQSVIGGGAAPAATLPSYALAVASATAKADGLACHLRHWETPIIARVENDRVLLDLRTVAPGQEEVIVAALSALPSLRERA